MRSLNRRARVERRPAPVRVFMSLTASLLLIASACAPPTDVVAVQSRPSAETVTSTTTGTTATTGTTGTLQLSPCDDIADEFVADAADLKYVDLADWECGWLTVPVDPARPNGETIELAVTRRPGDSGEGRALFFNPGGPGGSGIQSVWSLWDLLPASVLDAYDIVGWDPRGVGSSKPALKCPDQARWDDRDLFEICEGSWGPLPGYMATANTVADLEALRVALGQESINYVGYSYGTYIGALYASAYPDRVGHFVLDGSVSPDSATDRTPISQGDAWYADDGYDDAVSRFDELCRVTSLCAIDDDPMGAIADAADDADDLTVEGVADNRDLSYGEVWDTFDAALTTPSSWAVFSVAVERARDGDGSALAAMALTFETNDEPDGSDDFVRADDNRRLANMAIYCSDFADVSKRSEWCEGLSPNRYSGGAIERVDTALPIVVIGNEYDPLTPFQHAREMAGRLGDAALIEWRGVGHTVFPGESDCVDEAVEDFLIDDVVPEGSLQCSFVDGIANSDVGELGDFLFDLDPGWLETLVMRTLEDEGLGDPECLATTVVDHGDDAAIDVFLEIESPAAQDALRDAQTVCD